MSKLPADESNDAEIETAKAKPARSDSQRNKDALLVAAFEVFSTSGVDAPVREIAAKAGVGVGTVYRHFPQRSDLIVGVFRRQVDDCADAAMVLAAEHAPDEALALWLQRYADFFATKRGLANALFSGDPAYNSLPAYFEGRFEPALSELLDAAASTGEIRNDIESFDLLRAVASLCMSVHYDPDFARRMVALLVDGLRYTRSQTE